MDDVTTLEAERIFWEINAQQPDRRQGFGAEYIGLRVNWFALFDTAEADRKDSSKLLLLCRLELRSPYAITAQVAADEFPHLLRLSYGEPIRLRGIIRSIDPECIDLELRAVEIDPAFEPA
jgi:hypothetical protein